MSILISGVKIVDSFSPHNSKKLNVLIKNGFIEYIGNKSPASRRRIDASNAMLSPGWFDLRANFCDPGYEHKEDLSSGISTAQASGYTGVALLPNTNPVIQTKNDINYIQRFNSTSLVQIYPVAAVTTDTDGENLIEMMDAHAAGAVAFSDGAKNIWNTDMLLKSLQYVRKFDGLIIDRPEDKWLSLYGTMHEGVTSTLLGVKGIPCIAEELAVQRDLEILAYTGGRLHLSMISTAGSVALIRKAKKKGMAVTCDVAVHNLIFLDENVGDYDTNYKVNPPFRTSVDIQSLKKGLKDGTIDAIVSDHQPQDTESKMVAFEHAEFGITALETMLPSLVMLSKELSMHDLIYKISTAPRKILNMELPTVQKGERANLTLFNMDEKWTYDDKTCKSKSMNSPWFGEKLRGRVLGVFNNGTNQLFS